MVNKEKEEAYLSTFLLIRKD